MRERCRITKPGTGGGEVWDDELLQYVPVPDVIAYEGKCGLNFGSTEPRSVSAADQSFVEQVGKIKLPVEGSADVARGDHVEVLESETDPDMAGAVFAIGARRFRSNPSSRRFTIEETQ